MTVELEPGSVVAGRYRLDRLLGKGGMGHVWAVTHAVTQRVSALKLLHGPMHARPDRRRRFIREARAASAINHPNVVAIHDFFELEDGTPVMLMDLLEGETFGHRLAREGSLSLRDAVDVLLPVISAVGTAHALGIVHRDLKPDNVFLVRGKDGSLDVRVLDFGIAKLTAQAAGGMNDANDANDAVGATDTGAMLGTPHYMSPEQCFNQDEVDHRTDVWAIGVMLYEALSGARPVDGENVGRVLAHLMTEVITPIRVLAPELPEDVGELVGRMLARDKTERPADLREVHDALSRYASVSVPSFDAATRERPPPLDSNPSSVHGGPRPPAPAAFGDTELAPPPVSSKHPVPSLAAAEEARDPARRAPAVLLLPLFAVVAVIAWVALRGSESDRRPSAEASASVAPPSTTKPPEMTTPPPVTTRTPLPPSIAGPAEAAQAGASGSASPSERKTPPVAAARSSGGAPSPAPAPARSAVSPGLVDEPPF